MKIYIYKYIYEARAKGKDDMDVDAVDPGERNEKENERQPNWDDYTSEEWRAYEESLKEELMYLGQKGKGKGGGKSKGKGKGCHYCGGDHLKAECGKLKADKKKWDEERAAKGLPPFVPRAKGAGRNNGKNTRPLRSLDEDAEETIDRDYEGIGMLEKEEDSDGDADCGSLEPAPLLMLEREDSSDDEGDDKDFQTIAPKAEKLTVEIEEREKEATPTWS